MAMNEAAILGAADKAARLDAEFAGMDTTELMRAVIADLFPGQIALVSSFGADSAVLLHMAALIDKATPVLFIDTQLLFKETLAYRDTLVAHLGLTNVIALTPKPQRLAEEDPENFLWASDPDRCCEIRKVLPLAEALEGYDAWITGRKRFQGQTRAALALFEARPAASKSIRSRIRRRTRSPIISMPLPCRVIRSSPKAIFRLGASLHLPVKPGEDPARGVGASVRKSNAGFIHCRFSPVRTFDNGDIQRRWLCAG